jgi:hypothetical protein
MVSVSVAPELRLPLGKRDYHIYESVFYSLVDIARVLGDKCPKRFKSPLRT